ncbi:MAG TPA: NAD(P)(+) transhydrogenase (Re/Si-specific) subunit beta, partial [Verrucomicrobiae bacterium]|nr:NAD(P)(+) transhydrogenase (Re/Si-specific) subunit beta [Verrucomicrobiae bacterium]
MSSSIALTYIAAAVLFILGIKFLSSPKTARYGNLLAAFGMLIALVATIPLLGTGETSLLKQGWNLSYTLMVVGIVIGLIIGAIGAYSVKMTAMPQMVAAFNGLGGGSAALVASLEFLRRAQNQDITAFVAVTMLFATLIGSLSFSGSIIAFLKLEGKFEKPHTFPGQNLLNGLILAVILGLCVYLTGWVATNTTAFVVMFVLALVFGVAMVMPIGGADMPVVISLLNSFTGLAVAADGFTINNISMIVAGTLVGSSGTLLTLLMCRAMNRPVTNVLFGAFGSGGGGPAAAAGVAGTVKPIQA